ncbi:Fanconi Anemia group J protein, FANCJ [Carpediemonas membranifera]|uniref:Fanconi Anemia group J protein, FANCJ n=1 Tax=Carpediemonas membranifera TaxID=201153 RepID=A0A8J6DZP6_9EUKA|nr:Fanconi Anemia group J protein, FANCJ [Carpediemonas membranifera]|eukprot:KAG9391028.1 Fanconi Anemia group J protein, FANCJ [Carpediemonas membranifera]
MAEEWNRGNTLSRLKDELNSALENHKAGGTAKVIFFKSATGSGKTRIFLEALDAVSKEREQNQKAKPHIILFSRTHQQCDQLMTSCLTSFPPKQNRTFGRFIGKQKLKCCVGDEPIDHFCARKRLNKNKLLSTRPFTLEGFQEFADGLSDRGMTTLTHSMSGQNKPGKSSRPMPTLLVGPHAMIGESHDKEEEDVPEDDDDSEDDQYLSDDGPEEEDTDSGQPEVTDAWCKANADHKTLVMIHHYGGCYAEGADLPPRMVGLALLFGRYYGVPMPSMDSIFDGLFSMDNDSDTMRQSGRIASQQAGGRAVRGPEDHGVVVCIDSKWDTWEEKPLNSEEWLGTIENDDDEQAVFNKISDRLATPHPEASRPDSILLPVGARRASSRKKPLVEVLKEQDLSFDVDFTMDVPPEAMVHTESGESDDYNVSDIIWSTAVFEILKIQHKDDLVKLSRAIKNLGAVFVVSQIQALFTDPTGMAVDSPMLTSTRGNNDPMELFVTLNERGAKDAVTELTEWVNEMFTDELATVCRDFASIAADRMMTLNGRANFMQKWDANRLPVDSEEIPQLSKLQKLLKDELKDEQIRRGSYLNGDKDNIWFTELVYRVAAPRLAQFTRSILQSISIKEFVTMKTGSTGSELFHTGDGSAASANRLLTDAARVLLEGTYIPHLLREMSDGTTRVNAVLAVPIRKNPAQCHACPFWPPDWDFDRMGVCLRSAAGRANTPNVQLLHAFQRSSFSIGSSIANRDCQPIPCDRPVLHAFIIDTDAMFQDEKKKKYYQGIALLASILRSGYLSEASYKSELRYLEGLLDIKYLAQRTPRVEYDDGRLTLLVNAHQNVTGTDAEKLRDATLTFTATIADAIEKGTDLVLHIAAHGTSTRVEHFGALKEDVATVSVILGHQKFNDRMKGIFLNLNLFMHEVNMRQQSVNGPGQLLILSMQCRPTMKDTPIDTDTAKNEEKTLLINHLPDLPGIVAFFAQSPPFKNMVHNNLGDDTAFHAIKECARSDETFWTQYEWLTGVVCDQFALLCVLLASRAVGHDDVFITAAEYLRDSRDATSMKRRQSSKIVPMQPVLSGKAWHDDRMEYGVSMFDFVQDRLNTLIEKN